MIEENIYANKPLKMVKNAEELITPLGLLYLTDRDFLTFELSFFYYFIYDYKIFSQLHNELRRKILHAFLDKIQSSRSNDFPNLKTVNKIYETRIFTYAAITQKVGKIEEFGEQCADYINTLLCYSEQNNVFTCHNFDQAQKELKPNIEPNKYTDELKVLLIMSSYPLLINGIDPLLAQIS